jgi:hypothetical protein
MHSNKAYRAGFKAGRIVRQFITASVMLAVAYALYLGLYIIHYK